jgi:hypothetical protein
MGVPTQIGEHPHRVITITIDHLINDIGISAANQAILRQIEAALADINDEFIDIKVNLYAGAIFVTQRFEITASDLTTKDVANDILITDGSPVPFRWNVAVFPYSISVGFGQSVEPWMKLNDTTHNNDAFRKEWDGLDWVDVERSGLCMSVFDEPEQLQCYEWDSHILTPKAWVIGQTVQLTQIVSNQVVLP